MAQVFKDNLDREWIVDINVTSIKRVRTLTEDEVNLFAACSKKERLMEKLSTDPELLCNVVYCLCKPQAEERQLSEDDFGEAMSGEAIDSATAAVLEGLALFFRKGQRRLIQAATAKMEKLEDVTVERALEHVESPDFDAAFDKLLTAELEELSASFGSSPESSESTPAP